MINSYQNSIIAQLLEAITGQINFTGTPTSNIGDILLSILEQTPYDKEPKSVLAELFLKLKDKLEGRAFTPYDKEPKSAIAEILLSILNETEYDKEPNSRVAELLLELKSELESYAELTASGAIANFTTSLARPLVNLTAFVKATQEAGTPTPQSPKAISGVSAVSVYHKGANLFDISTKTNGKALKWNDGDTFTDAQSIVSNYIEAKEGAKFTSNYNAQWCCYDKNKNYLGNIVSGSLVTTSGNDITTNTIPSGYGVYYLRLGFRSSTNNNANMTEKTDIVLSVGNIALPFETFNSSTTLINLGGTYYGGYITQDKNGKRELTVTSVKKKLSDYVWTKSNINTAGTGRVWYKDFNSDAEINILPETLCNSFSYQNAPNWNNLGLYSYYAINRYFVFCVEDNYNTSEEMLQDYGNIEFTAFLKTPYTIDLPDGEPITAFNGVNNIYNDSGDTSVTYLAKVADNLNATAKFRAEVKAQKEKAKEEEKEIIKEDPIEEIKEPVKDSGETKKGANKA